MELRLLKYFVAVAEELHFGRAAQRLHIAQPPLSQQIHRLEEELGVQLFVRNNKHVELTEAGQILLGHAREILQHVEDAVMATQRVFKGEIGQLTIGFVGSATQDLVPMVHTYRLLSPAVQINLRQMTRFEQVNELKAGKIHIGFHRPPINDLDLSALIVHREPFLIALPENHSLSKFESIPVYELANEPFVLPPKYWGSSYYDKVVDYCISNNFFPKVIQDATEASTIVELVAAGFGVSFVPTSTASKYKQGVQYRPLKEEAPFIEMAAVWRKNAEESSTILHSFLEIVRKY